MLVMASEYDEVLLRLGLTHNESKVYLELLSIGTTMAGEIAKRTNLHRRVVYDSLYRLVERGLVTYNTKNGKKVFQATHPSKLMDSIKSQESVLKEMLPGLVSKFESKRPLIFSQVFEGKEGVKQVFEDILKTKKDWYSIGATGVGFLILPVYMQQFGKRRVELGIKRKILLANNALGRKSYSTFKKQELVEIKYLPEDVPKPQTIWIYGNKVGIVLASEEYPICFLIENESIAKSYLGYFNLLWKNGIKN